MKRKRGNCCGGFLFFCAIRPEDDRRACTSGHPTGNGHRVATPRDERGIAMIGWGCRTKQLVRWPLFSSNKPNAGLNKARQKV